MEQAFGMAQRRDQLLALHAEIALIDRIRLVSAHRDGLAVLEIDEHRARVEAEPAIGRTRFTSHVANSRTRDGNHEKSTQEGDALRRNSPRTSPRAREGDTLR